MKRKALLVLVAAGGALSGAEEHPCVFGMEMYLSHPAGALNDAFTSDTGNGCGLFLEWDLGNGHGLRGDLSLATTFPRKTKVIQGVAADCALSSSCTAVSYTYHLKGGRLGPYLMAGLGIKVFEASNKDPSLVPRQVLPNDALLTSNRFVADTGRKLAWLVGAGYHFTQPVGVTVRCVGMQAMGHVLTTLEGGINFRF